MSRGWGSGCGLSIRRFSQQTHLHPPLRLVEVKNVRSIPLPLYCPLFDAFPSAPFVTVRILTSVRAFLRGESTVFKTAAIDHSATPSVLPS